jgi:tetraacyldisaccharide 4'-kinase
MTLARMLVAAGERPSILSRGYRRPEPSGGIVVVSDGNSVLATAERSGDEPYMLANVLAGAPILVASDRYAAGSLAENRLGCTVHILDDGFQHVQLARDVNLLVAGRRDLDDRVVPSGTLREPLAAAGAADALLVVGTDEDVRVLADRLRVATAFRVTTKVHPVRSDGEANPQVRRAVAVAGIARPDRFLSALRDQGWEITRQFVFRDHHWFTPQEVQHIDQAARDAGAIVITTEKDAARLKNVGAVPWAILPIEAAIEERFASWLAGRLAAARRQRGEAA